MLVLTRKVDERIIIGEGLIEVVVCEIRGDRVRLGIVAPKNISVHREEIYRLIEKNRLGSDALEATRLGG